ncbi:hypothetical protein MKW92_005914 [Papaver armeniacum]|nr:hypothetical protein MKW92_005914 [Papaver armeniacum]
MEEPPPPPPPPPPYLSILENCIISSSQEDLLDQKGFAFSDNIHQDGQIDEEFEQPSLPLDDHSTGIRICSLEDDSISSSSGDGDEDLAGEAEKTTLESLNQKNLGLSKGNHGDDSIGEEEDREKIDKGKNNLGEHCGVEGGEKRIRLIGECSTGGHKKYQGGEKAKELEDEEEDIMSIVIKAGLEMPQPRWWRSGGYESR